MMAQYKLYVSSYGWRAPLSAKRVCKRLFWLPAQHAIQYKYSAGYSDTPLLSSGVLYRSLIGSGRTLKKPQYSARVLGTWKFRLKEKQRKGNASGCACLVALKFRSNLGSGGNGVSGGCG
jgi:hypothetical protein